MGVRSLERYRQSEVVHAPIRARRANVTKAHASSLSIWNMARRAKIPDAIRMARRTMRKAMA